jgi:hypothetical protein
MALSGPSPALRTTPVDSADARPHTGEPGTAVVESSAKETALVTVTGCLVSEEGAFRLNDTAGAQAPKSRSWKTGFLKKRPASIALVDASGVGLRPHVGQRVALTGTLADRDMHVRSLTRVGSCAE